MLATATAAALLLAYAPGDAPVRFAPAAYQLVSDPVDEPLYFPPTADQIMADAGTPGLVPFWGGVGVSALTDAALLVAFFVSVNDVWDLFSFIDIGLAVEMILKPLLIALAESTLANDSQLFWPAAAAAYLGVLAGGVLLVLATLTESSRVGGVNIFGIASGAVFVLGVPGLTAWPVFRWSF